MGVGGGVNGVEGEAHRRNRKDEATLGAGATAGADAQAAAATAQDHVAADKAGQENGDATSNSLKDNAGQGNGEAT